MNKAQYLSICTCSMLAFWFAILPLVLQGKSKVQGAKVETCMYNHVLLDLELNELNFYIQNEQ